MLAALFRCYLHCCRRARLAGAAYGLVCAAACVLVPPASATEVTEIQAQRRGSAVQVTTQAVVRAPYELIWKALTDYDRLAEFVPGITSSKVLQRQGNTVTVEQSGSAKLWFFTYPIDVVVEVTEQPPTRLSVRVLKGNLRQLEGGYRLDKVEGQEDEYRLQWSGLIEPADPVPHAISLPLIRKNIAQQFEGMVREIERREASRGRARE
jgi:ribosome-associated toxin RatA of RatAB toxin-antitoxin module